MTRLYRSLLLVGLILLSGCVKQGPNLAVLPADDLYAQATAAYEANQYGRAIPYLQAFVENHLGDPRAPDARLMLARAHMQRREEITAIMHYQRLVNDFPSSPLQLDARFGICEAYNQLSPRPALDPEYTQSAILHCESISQYYPGTEEAETAAGYVTVLREKLAQKLYDTAVYYADRRVFDAAVIYFEDVVREYPTTTFAPASLKRLSETYSRIGYVEDAEEARERLLRDYPDSAEARGLRPPSV
jgi:outer membrane protein assembly factor BamD